MSDLARYFNAKDKRKSAYNLYNYASTLLKLETIRERLAEVKSQHEPIAGLLDKKLSERDRLHAIAFYVVVGRFPEEASNAQD